MTRTLALIAIACASGLDYQSARNLVDDLNATLPADDLDAGRIVAEAAMAEAHPI